VLTLSQRAGRGGGRAAEGDMAQIPTGQELDTVWCKMATAESNTALQELKYAEVEILLCGQAACDWSIRFAVCRCRALTIHDGRRFICRMLPTLFLPVILSAWFGGIWPGLLATALAR